MGEYGADRDMTVAEAATAAGVSRQAVYRWVTWGQLAARGEPGSLRIAPGDLRTFLAVRRTAAATGLRAATLRRLARGSGERRAR